MGYVRIDTMGTMGFVNKVGLVNSGTSMVGMVGGCWEGGTEGVERESYLELTKGKSTSLAVLRYAPSSSATP